MDVTGCGKRRLKTSLNGHIAESFVQLQLCVSGCSVNNITVSDYGIDLHVQIPEIEDWQFGTETLNDDSLLAPLFAHIQVKYRSDGKAEIPKSELMGWIDCSVSGLATYLFIVKGECSDLSARYFDSNAMIARLRSSAELTKSVTFSFDEGRPIDNSNFIPALYMNSKYPLLMRQINYGCLEKQDFLSSYISELALGYCIENDLPQFDSTEPFNSSAYKCVERLCEEVNGNLVFYKMAEPLDACDVFCRGEFERLDYNVRNGYFPCRSGEYSVLFPSFFYRDNGSEEDAMRGLSCLFDLGYFSGCNNLARYRWDASAPTSSRGSLARGGAGKTA